MIGTFLGLGFGEHLFLFGEQRMEKKPFVLVLLKSYLMSVSLLLSVGL